jgi:hypothetical protein
MTCPAKIRPFPNSIEVSCGLPHDGHTSHEGEVRDYAFPGSVSMLYWEEGDRRTFSGDWNSCDESTCILPAGHHGNHVT